MDINKEREAFEAWLIKKFKVKANDYALSFVDGKYQCIPTKARWESWLASKESVADGFVLVEKSEIESWYLDDYEGMYTDEPDNFLSELDIGDVQAVKRKDYLIIDERTLYAARPWNKNDEDADCWEFYESKDEADLVAENCLKNWNGDEAQEQSDV